MSDPVRIPLRAVVVFHDRQIARHGGAAGFRDLALLEAACRPAVNRHAYASASLVELAAAYAFGIAKARAFVDGNKRTACVTAVTFLRVNGLVFRTDAIEGVRMMEDLAAGKVLENDFADWLARDVTPIG
ncbi:type II toxin-antitoxin system death-on-curing family toxin [Qingshengfaniella alkalisoli]|uniref:Type II toxin-antitoxin system death-on-curing family toxin n=1 Tax=Qingshengfaniella alkalisoli TaxID=2599296 RepID=A0A5B8J0J4_9RHOB|nr:type II toxin-antitoxin system death-on-curing family toxin [Qingshengfaniella alkalisoli]QDY70398.1 type II toxin-antitoxin system death-on-curing family toxin [Qingshengfaniella alkalisoli]